MKNDMVVKLLSVAGLVLTAAGTLASNMSQQKTMDETIKKEVEKALQKK